MELTPFASSLKQSRDYLGLTIDSKSAGTEYETMSGLSKIEANVGDVLCLSTLKISSEDEQPYADAYDEDGFSEQSQKSSIKWLSQSPNVVRLFVEDTTAAEKVYVGVCLNKGYNTLTQSSMASSSLIEISVRPMDHIKFITQSSAKYLTNQVVSETGAKIG